jgi:hypothetical protein
MVAAVSVPQNGVLVKLGAGSGPIVYTAPCAFTERSIRWEKTTTETDIPDCGDPGLPGWVAVDVISRMLRISGGGILSAENWPVWNTAYEANTPTPARLELVLTGSVTYAYEGLLHITSLEPTANRADGRAQLTIEAVSTGAFLRVLPA